MIKIVKADSIGQLKALVFGPSGSGKTHLLGTAQSDPRTSPMLLLDYEGGTTSLKGLDVDMIKIRDWKDYDEVREFLRRGDHLYKSVGIDSITEAHLGALFQILEAEAKNRRDPDMLQQGDYGKAGSQLRRMLRMFRDLPMHVFATALVKEDTDVREGLVKKPSLSGQLADDVPGIFEIVAYLSLATMKTDGGADQTVRALILQNYPKIRAKVRAGWGVELPNEVIDPSVTKLLDLAQIPMPEGSRDQTSMDLESVLTQQGE